MAMFPHHFVAPRARALPAARHAVGAGYPRALQIAGYQGHPQIVGVDAAGAPIVAVPTPAAPPAQWDSNSGSPFAGLVAQPGPRVEETTGRGWREFPLGFGPTAFTPGLVATVQQQPQKKLFRPSRLVIPSVIGINFSVRDIKIGVTSQFVSDNPLPALAFSETSVGVAMRLDTCTLGMIIFLDLQNVSAAQTLNFSAIFYGTSTAE